MVSSTAWLENGKQAIKTAVAGVVSLYVTRLFHLPEGYWASISALIVMQSNVGATLSASRTRLAGTAIGAVVGGLFAAVLGENVLGFALAVAVSFFLCGMLRLADAQRLATVTVAIIMLIGHTTSAWTVALHRFLEVALGILVALLVSLTLWPNHARRSVRLGLADALGKIGGFYQSVMLNYRSKDPVSTDAVKASVNATIRDNNNLLQNALQEAFGPMKERESLSLLAHQVERVYRAAEALEFAVRDSSLDSYHSSFEGGLGDLEDHVGRALASLSKSISAWKVHPEWPNLTSIIEAIDNQAAQARTVGATMNYPLDEILRFYYLLLSSRNLISELELAHAFVSSRIPSRRT